MKKILVLSDLHGTISCAASVLKNHPEYDTVFFLGDGISKIALLQKEYPRLWHFVRGNCDLLSDGAFPEEMLIELEGHRIFLTHGHRYFVKYDENRLLSAAAARGADIVLYGHTHLPAARYDAASGIHLFNPGSIGAPYNGKFTYGLLTLSGTDVLFSIGEQSFGRK